MSQLEKFVRVVQRQPLRCAAVEGFMIPLLEPLFLIDTHMTFNERLSLFSLAMSQPIGFVACEIGSYLGASTSFLAAAASFRQGHVHAIDTWKNDAMTSERVEDTWKDFLDNIDGYRLWITPHRGVAHEVKDQVPLFDMLFIDGDHSYEGALANLSDFVPKLKPGGLVAMHDFNVDSVSQAMTDYFKDRPLEDVELTHTLKAFRPR